MKEKPGFSNFKALVALLFISFLSCSSPTGSNSDNSTDVPGYTDDTFFSTSGTQILNRQGEPVVIRGFGLGGWLMPEGYMFNMPGDFGPTKLRNAITDLLGESETDRWFEEFRTNYVQEEDIIAMKEWGADHIRVPFNHKVFYDMETEEFNEREFDRLDQLLIWCKRNRVDVILDMHGAPGAQSSKEIADSDGVARLWTEYDTYMPVTIKIWTEIARRYKNETIIIGYDLLNEPVTPAGYGADDVLRFHTDLIPEIRKIDENHILFINGNYYSTTFDKLDILAAYYDNIVYAFHKYWNETDQGTINYLLGLRDQTDTPLWLGESGENSNPWFNETVRLVESNGIGWNWWTHKKLETITSPLSAPSNPNYEKVLAYWKGDGPKPTANEARQGLFDMAEGLKIENTTFRPDVVAALFSPSFNNENVPFTSHSIPGTIDAVNYDIGDNLIAYNDMNYKRVNGDPDQTGGNSGWVYRNDGVDIEPSTLEGLEYNVGWTEDGEWLEYTVEATEGTYDIRVIVASPSGEGRIRLFSDGRPVGNTTNIPATGGYQNWRQVNLGSDQFSGGTYTLRLQIDEGGFNIAKLIID
ncbi:cellulase family glycosylhydrolase [Gracilimonas sp.]|uniref:cellulase family glycosylhydrolase n=1 Tax=Gracilimonas sp. TaxID=1974203 RepID=UPI003D1083A8